VGDRLSQVDISWTAIVLAVVTIFAALFARRWMAERTDQGRLPLILLVLSLVLRALAVPIEMDVHEDVVTGLKLASAITLAAGMTGVVGRLVFDAVVARLFVFPTILRDIILFVAFVIVVMTILQQSGANLVSLVTTSAVLTAVIGLALQQPIANMFAGLSLQLDRTIVVGDWIKIDDRIGRIEKVSFRATTILTRDDDTVTFPNAYFMQNAVLNYTRPINRHRMWCEVGFHYRHPPNDVKQVLSDAIAGCPGVLTDPIPQVLVRTFGDSSVNYVVLYWITDFGHDINIDSEVKTRIWYAARRAGLEIPFPQRVVEMHEVTEETKQRREARDLDGRRDALHGVELFSNLEDADLDVLAKGMTHRLFAAGERLVKQGDAGDSLFLIASGEVGVVLAVDGAERQVATLRGGDVLGELSLMTGESRAATCIALRDTEAHEISHALFEDLLKAKPALADTFSAILTDRQGALDAQRGDMTAEASVSRRMENKRQLLRRIQSYFRLG
jgi:small-conductance mechanosensitive channel/CRP-like cAMP-binding protein